MATTTGTAKLANFMIRFRSTLFSEVKNVYMPAYKQKQYKLQEFLKEISSKALQSDVARKMRVAKGFYQLEMSPPKMDEMKQLKEDIQLFKEFFENGCFKYITVKQAWLLFLVGLEVYLWFYLGETIGKMHIVGYKV